MRERLSQATTQLPLKPSPRVQSAIRAIFAIWRENWSSLIAQILCRRPHLRAMQNSHDVDQARLCANQIDSYIWKPRQWQFARPVDPPRPARQWVRDEDLQALPQPPDEPLGIAQSFLQTETHDGLQVGHGFVAIPDAHELLCSDQSWADAAFQRIEYFIVIPESGFTAADAIQSALDLLAKPGIVGSGRVRPLERFATIGTARRSLVFSVSGEVDDDLGQPQIAHRRSGCIDLREHPRPAVFSSQYAFRLAHAQPNAPAPRLTHNHRGRDGAGLGQFACGGKFEGGHLIPDNNWFGAGIAQNEPANN